VNPGRGGQSCPPHADEGIGGARLGLMGDPGTFAGHGPAMQGIAALGSNAGAWNQRILLNSDIDCICENSVCAACNAVLSSWYWLNASA
jgi:hypothetical protein